MGSSDSMGDDVPREETVCSQGLSNKEHPDVHKAAGLLGHCFFNSILFTLVSPALLCGAEGWEPLLKQI